MNTRIRAVLISAIASVALLASSGRAHAAIELSPSVPISAVLTNPSGGFLSLLPASNPACGSSGNQFNVSIGQVGMTADGAKSALAVALTAYALSVPIRVYFDPSIAGCPVQQVILGIA